MTIEPRCCVAWICVQLGVLVWLGVPLACAADDTVNDEISPHDISQHDPPQQDASSESAYAITFSDGERIYTSQCGLNVATFLLERFGREYNLRALAADLQPGFDGIALGRLQRALQAHGLQAEARQNIRLADLRRPLMSGAVAILPIKAGPQEQSRHYVLALHDRRRGFLLVDVPRHVAPLFEHLDDQRLSEPVALFVSRPSAGSPRQSDQIELDAEQIDLGQLDLDAPDGHEPFERVLQLRNRGQLPVRLELETSCGCLRLDWTAGTLEPNQTQAVRMTVRPGQWGIGPGVQWVYLSFPDKGLRRIEVTGEALAQAPYEFTLAQRTFTLDCTELETTPLESRDTELTIERTIDVAFDGAVPDRFQAESSAAWLSATIRQIDDTRGQVKLTARITPELFDTTAPKEAKLQVTAYTSKPSQVVTVRLVRRDFYQLARRSITLARGSEEQQIEFLPVASLARQISLRAAHCDREGLSLAAHDRDDGSAELRVAAGDDASLGNYAVRCELLSDRGAARTAWLYVNVTE